MTVLYFAGLREFTGMDSEQIETTGSISEDLFWELLELRHSGITSRRRYVRIARNQVYLEACMMLEPGDEIALIPPVSGG